jgi:predicted acyl esterase
LVGWVAGLPPASADDVTIQQDIAVPMREGVVLRADRYMPEGEFTPFAERDDGHDTRACWTRTCPLSERHERPRPAPRRPCRPP